MKPVWGGTIYCHRENQCRVIFVKGELTMDMSQWDAHNWNLVSVTLSGQEYCYFPLDGMLVHWMKGVTPQQYVIRIHFIVNEYGWPVRQSEVEYAIPLTVISETTCRLAVVQRWILVSKYSYA